MGTMKTQQNRGNRGFTVVEVTIVAAILAIILGVIAESTKISSDAANYAKDLGRITMLCQNRMGLMRDDLSSSVRLYQADTEGLSYWYYLEKDDLQNFATTRPPTIMPEGTFGQETSAGDMTGNVLIFAKASRPFPTADDISAWHTYCDDVGAPGNKTALDGVRIDIYRIVAYYMRTTYANGALDPGVTRGLDLTRWVSEPFADRDRINALDATIKPLVVQALTLDSTRGVNFLWQLGAQSYTAFSEIQPDFSTIDIDIIADPSWRIPRDREWSEESILLRRNVSVATMWAPANYGLGKFNTGFTTGYGFPHGFEIQIVGPTAARQVMIHMVLLNYIERGQNAWVDLQEVVTCRDL